MFLLPLPVLAKKNPPAASSLAGGFMSFLRVCVASVRVALARVHDIWGRSEATRLELNATLSLKDFLSESNKLKLHNSQLFISQSSAFLRIIPS